MDESVRVRVGERVANLACDVDDFLKRGQVGVAQSLTGNQLHHEERLAVFVANVVDRHDVRVIQHRGGPGFPEESTRIPFRRILGRKNLDRDLPLELEVRGPVDYAHSPTSQLVIQTVSAAEEGARRERLHLYSMSDHRQEEQILSTYKLPHRRSASRIELR